MAKPWIGVAGSFEEKEFPPRTYVHSFYYDAVRAKGGVPVVLAHVADDAYREEVLDRIDGLLLCGGDDIDPTHFAQPLHPKAKLVSARRYSLDRGLFHGARRREMPVLAICYGMQAVNVCLGGDLIQDVPDLVPGALTHRAPAGSPLAEHEVIIDADTALAALLGAGEIAANSHHHQAIGRLAPGLRVAAHAPDGIVEAIEPQDPEREALLLAVQWHPERIADRDPHGRLFARLVEEASRRHRTR